MNWYNLWTDNPIGVDDGAHLLYDSLRYNSTLTELNLGEECEHWDNIWMIIIWNNEETYISRWKRGI